MTDAFQHIAYISAGSNIGDTLSNCQNGIAALTESGNSVLLKQSRFYKTEPVDYKNQDWFVNAAAKIETMLEPFQLLEELRAVEQEAGRVRTVKFGPRILDLDILLYDNMVMESPDLTIPHSRMHKRRFVLQPLCDIDPEMVHPVLRKNMKYLLKHLKDDGQRIFLL